MNGAGPRPFDARPFATGRNPRRQAHFSLTIGSATFAFCYIRKNASSSFKRLFLDASPHRDSAGGFPTPIAFMGAMHRADAEAVARADRLLLVARDPLERAASIWRNKFVQRFGAAGIFENYRKLTGRDPEDATFADFALDYAAAPSRRLDPHLVPQVDHLLPVTYTDAATLDTLHAAMTGIVGAALADRHFGAPANATRAFGVAEIAEPWRVAARDLHAHFTRTGEMPAPADLLAPEIATALAGRYAADVALFAAISGAGPRVSPPAAARARRGRTRNARRRTGNPL